MFGSGTTAEQAWPSARQARDDTGLLALGEERAAGLEQALWARDPVASNRVGRPGSPIVS